MARILIVDDEPELLIILERMLHKLNHNTALAGNGKEAVRRLEDAPFDVVLTDLIMPESEGIETIATVRKKWPGVKIIAMSGGGRQSPVAYLAVAANLGADATLAKPFDRADLADALRQVLGPDETISSQPSHS
jgi:two-component system, cell cycle response regulator CpdR